MFERILLAADLSGASDELIRCMGGLRKADAREVRLAYCLDLHDVGPVRESAEAIVRPELDKQIDLLRGMGFEATGEVAVGYPQTEIERVAAQFDASLIVAGSRARSLAGEMLFGSVATGAIYGARRPVLLIRLCGPQEGDEPQACDNWPCAAMERIVFATDFSENAEFAFNALERLVEGGMTSVSLLHVQDRGTIGRHLQDRLDEFNAIDQGRLERMRDRLISKGAGDVTIELAYGYPAQEILNRAQQGGISLVVMGTQGRGFFSEVFVGSVSHAVARLCPRPVLLVPSIR